MFANFIYFIVALLILSLYEPPEDLPTSLARSLSLFAVMTLVFAFSTRAQFRRLALRAAAGNRMSLDHRFEQLSVRYAILGLALFAANIWWLHLPAFMQSLPFFSVLPSIKSLLLLLLFVAYLGIVWFFSFDAHRNIYLTEMSRRTYVYSNIAFSIPILIPWTLLFGITDVLRLLPFELPRRILDTSWGETSYFLIFLFITAIVAPVLVQRFWRCRPLADGAHRRRIEALCQRSGVRYADIVHWPIFGGRMVTAGVMGLVSRFRYIMVTNALLDILSPDEIDQVMAHEIGHVKRRHLLLYLLFFIGFMVISYSVFFISHYLIFYTEPVYRTILAMELKVEDVDRFFTIALMIVGAIVYFRYIFGYFMRNFERQADAYVFTLFPTAQPLISTFDKIVATSGQPAEKPNWHHFSIQQRIDFLNLCETDPKWIHRHNRKVQKSIALFLVGMVLLAFSTFQLSKGTFGHDKRYISLDYIESYLNQKQTKTADDAILYWQLGNAYFSRQMLAKAVTAYETSLLLSPDNPETMNNLAWLLVTSEDPELSDPQRALALAQHAIQIKKAPHILDTLAESLFANGKIEDAIRAEQEALDMNPEDRGIYENQLRKFKNARGSQP